MKKFNIYCIPILLILSIPGFLVSCNDDDDDEEELKGNWVELSDFEGVARSDEEIDFFLLLPM